MYDNEDSNGDLDELTYMERMNHCNCDFDDENDTDEDIEYRNKLLYGE